jgi:hypothetical protein
METKTRSVLVALVMLSAFFIGIELLYAHQEFLRPFANALIGSD